MGTDAHEAVFILENKCQENLSTIEVSSHRQTDVTTITIFGKIHCPLTLPSPGGLDMLHDTLRCAITSTEGANVKCQTQIKSMRAPLIVEATTIKI